MNIFSKGRVITVLATLGTLAVVYRMGGKDYIEGNRGWFG